MLTERHPLHRRLAQNFERGRYGDLQRMIVVVEDSNLSVQERRARAALRARAADITKDAKTPEDQIRAALDKEPA